MMGRWLATLSEYGVTNDHIVYRKGVLHINADSLSRIPVQIVVHITALASIAAMRLADVDDDVWTLLEIQQAQRKDPSINRIIGWLEEGLID